jgi:hypothetical protein
MLFGEENADRYCKVVQRPEGLWLYPSPTMVETMCSCISGVERAGLAGLAEGQKVTFELKTDKMRGKVSAENLSLA